MKTDPWTEIGLSGGGFNLRRVDPSHPANYFWARDADGRCALVLVLETGVTVDEPRPRLNGIEIIEAPDQDGKHAFVLVLKREEDRELFRHLCHDIVDACRSKVGDQAFLASTLRRAWKWHSLLRGGANQRLSPQEQQGLIGELLFLERLIRHLTPKAAIEAWRGPLDEPKDFVFSNRAVEVKARHVSKDAVKISSEHQLQVIQGQQLALAVVALSPSVAHAPEGISLDSLVQRVRGAVIASDPSADEGFDARLLSAGYSTDHDYSDTWWLPVATSAYAVGEGFPRIEATGLPEGVSLVTYWLRLDLCAPFEHAYDDLFHSEPSNE
ncbi:MAG: PD-(D/E)XK motif protein [Alphaproteobacteria bacterium]|nr:PD-(D/E)XK motif protein [Alphaproteobacteria bacterium]